MGMGEIALARSHHERAQARFEEAMSLYRRVETCLGKPTAFQIWATSRLPARITTLPARFEEALRSIGKWVLTWRGQLHSGSGRASRSPARNTTLPGRTLKRRCHSVAEWETCVEKPTAFSDLGRHRVCPLADHNDARARLEEALPLYRQVGYVAWRSQLRFQSGQIALERSQYNEAQARFEKRCRYIGEWEMSLGKPIAFHSGYNCTSAIAARRCPSAL